MQKEMSEFVLERIKIEEKYPKNLAAQEEGSLGEVWAQVKKSLANEAEVHLKFSAKLHSEVEKPLMNFRENFKKDLKKCHHHIADPRKQLTSRYASAERPGDEDPPAEDQAEQQDRGGHQEGTEKVHTGWQRPHALCGPLQPDSV
ncbi:hypothetical protein H1C71_013465 [Ictidomys tridecemlineatus]|nr:hypothetical protein H1C71_013465 [Ictidomys tridecemlineatus]